jgi:hypothetical protein
MRMTMKMKVSVSMRIWMLIIMRSIWYLSSGACFTEHDAFASSMSNVEFANVHRTVRSSQSHNRTLQFDGKALVLVPSVAKSKTAYPISIMGSFDACLPCCILG